LEEWRLKYVPVVTFGVVVVCILLLWDLIPPATGLRGIGEGGLSLLASPQDGFIEQILVPPRGWVEAGEPVATIIPFDPRSDLGLLQSSLQVSRLAIEASAGDPNAIDYERLRVDYLRLKQEVAMAKANLERARKVLPRHEILVKERLLPRDTYDLTVRDYDFYQAEVDEKSRTIEELDSSMERLGLLTRTAKSENAPIAADLVAGLEAQLARIQTNWNPITLYASISGEVGSSRQATEFVRAGEPFLTIAPARADRIVAYMRQPLTFEPEVGMQVEVITQSAKPRRFVTRIAQLGAQVEIITNALAYVRFGNLVDAGLPVILPVPKDVQIRPGEIVDIAWRWQSDSGGFFERLLGKTKPTEPDETGAENLN
jgi:multidrug resistance efflux pump